MDTQANLKKELTLVQDILAKPSPPEVTDVDVEAKIQAAEAEVKAAEALFPKVEQSLDITDSLFNLAQQSDLEVVGVSTNITKKNLNDIEYQVISLGLELEGQMGNILGFIAKLEKDLPTGEITSVSLQKAETVQELDKGKVGINIYCQGGS